MIDHKNFYITTADHKKLFVQEWLPEKDPKALILYVHGLGVHSNRVGPWAELFVKNQVGFIAYDQRGHGKSDLKRGQPMNISYLINDIKLLVELMKKKFPNVSVLLYGQSLGGNVAINYAIRNNMTVDGLIASSPWLILTNQPSRFLLNIVKILARITPGLNISNGLNPGDISRDKQEAQIYSDDPLNHSRISFGLLNSTINAGFKAIEEANKIKIPTLLIHGSADNITSPKASEEFAMKKGDQMTIKLWENAYHDLNHEPEREEIHNYIIDWMKQNKFL